GTTIAQRLDTAGQPDMPESAIATGCIDFVLAPEEIAKKIIQIAFGASQHLENRNGGESLWRP
ncbi:MAG TPA: chemotaxis protein CheB, partial [Caulobacteraceae bacterium]|nr:chemotaxis protein CheB [Caulobacteraceae bacterium]